MHYETIYAPRKTEVVNENVPKDNCSLITLHSPKGCGLSSELTVSDKNDINKKIILGHEVTWLEPLTNRHVFTEDELIALIYDITPWPKQAVKEFIDKELKSQH